MKIAIIGSGIVGQATGMGFAAKGNKVKFYDVDESKLISLKNKGYDATDELEYAIDKSEILFVCVPTPTIAKKIELKFINECTKTLAAELKKNNKYTVVAYRSTIPPQTTRIKLIPLLEAYSGLKSGKDFGVCVNPEFLREKSPLDDFLKPNRVVIGALDKKSGDYLTKIYSVFNSPLVATDLDSAEMIKYTSNTFLAAKISFFNEIFMICQKLHIDPRIVSTAVSLDPRIGNYGIEGGKPFGGMCLPKDLDAFIECLKAKGLNPTVLQAIAKVNEEIAQSCAMAQELEVRLQQPCLS